MCYTLFIPYCNKYLFGFIQAKSLYNDYRHNTKLSKYLKNSYADYGWHWGNFAKYKCKQIPS